MRAPRTGDDVEGEGIAGLGTAEVVVELEEPEDGAHLLLAGVQPALDPVVHVRESERVLSDAERVQDRLGRRLSPRPVVVADTDSVVVEFPWIDGIDKGRLNDLEDVLNDNCAAWSIE